MKKTAQLCLIAALLSGCVSTGTCKAKQAEADAQKTRADAAEAKVAQLTKDLDAAKKNADDLTSKLKSDNDQLTGLQATKDNLEKSNSDLKSSLDANKTQLSQKVSSLIKDRDDVKTQLTAADAKIGELQGQVSAAQATAQALQKAKDDELAQVKKSYEDMTSGLKDQIAAGQVQITQLKGKLTLNMVDQILFDSGKAEIKGDGQKVLDKVGAALNGIADKDIRIEGHTDNKPISGALQGKYATNWELSTARATAVARYLQDHAKVDPSRLVAAGYGEFRPKTSNDTPEGRAQNRRIEIVLVPRD